MSGKQSFLGLEEVKKKNPWDDDGWLSFVLIIVIFCSCEFCILVRLHSCNRLENPSLIAHLGGGFKYYQIFCIILLCLTKKLGEDDPKFDLHSLERWTLVGR